MQQTVAIGEIKKRAEALNLTLKRLARRANVHPSTAYRAVDAGDCRRSTEQKLGRELIAEELAILHHLIELHGVPGRDDRSAT
jgi:predicted transcriptional regulator